MHIDCEIEGLEESKMLVRILSGSVGVLALFLILSLPQTYFGIAITLLSFVGVWEFYQAFEKKGIKPLYGLGFLWVLLFGLYAQYGQQFEGEFSLSILSLAGYLTFTSLVIYLIFLKNPPSFTAIGITLLGILYVAFCFSYLTRVSALPNGLFFLIILFLGAWGTDTCAYFTGVLFGRKKIIPHISPKKTWEGFIGGALLSSIMVVFYGIFLENRLGIGISLVHYFVVGIVCGLLSQFGDWFASSIKRYTGIKDFANWMPGHGGVLDRFDSIIMISPFVFHYLEAVLPLL